MAGMAGVLLIGLSLPFVSNELMRFVEVAPPAPTEFKDVQAIVILGGGIHVGAPEYGAKETLSASTLVRVRYGAWLAKHRHLPILVSGGSVFAGTAEAQLMADALKGEFGVPVRWVEAESKDTADNAMLSSKLLKQEGIRRIALVSHAYHLRRATALFAKEGMSVLAATTFSTIPIDGLEAWLPSARNLDESFVAIHELAGRLQHAAR
ncbi:MAG TPA: YdcF family protein [Rhodocyclaceae bacterium]|nr:YdcF family protein [Rhodocyclaceae bacterium]